MSHKIALISVIHKKLNIYQYYLFTIYRNYKQFKVLKIMKNINNNIKYNTEKKSLKHIKFKQDLYNNMQNKKH